MVYEKKNFDGILNINKPKGISSAGVVRKLKYLFNPKKIGHGGTLDPLATGVLPILFGEATKFGTLSLEANKSYRAEINLGIVTTTGDSEGKVVKSCSRKKNLTEVEKVLPKFLGDQYQIPPMFSALKFNGTPLYKLARKDIELKRKPRKVKIFNLKILDFKFPLLLIEVSCSKGTYIRSLAEDIGNHLECGAHLRNLERISVGDFNIKNSLNFDDLVRSFESEEINRIKTKYLKPVEFFLNSYFEIHLNIYQEKSFLNGQKVLLTKYKIDSKNKEKNVKVYGSSGNFLGTGKIFENLILNPIRTIAQLKSVNKCKWTIEEI